MTSYKRNQIEEAITRIFYPNRQKPPSEFRTHIKLEEDNFALLRRATIATTLGRGG